MRKQKSSFISILILICMIMIICYNFLKDIDSKNNEKQTINQEKKHDNDVPTENYVTDTLGNKTTVSNINYLVELATITKTIKGMPKPISYSDKIKIDANGKILNDFSYIILELTIENTKDSDEILSLNNNTLIIKSEDKVIDMRETVSLNINEDKVNRKDYFMYNILAKEKKTIKFAYIISDNNMKNKDIILNIDPFGLIAEAERGKPIGKKIGRISLNNIIKEEK